MNEINPDSSCTKANKGVSTSATNQLSSSKQSSPLASMCPSVTVCDDRTSCILGELNKIYEERLADIDEQTNGNFELKYLTYKEWVEMLLKLIKDLIDVVQELEYEASSRIDLLEKKLQSEGGQGCNTTEISNLKNDVANLVELIRRTLDEGKWNLEGLNFSTLKLKDIFGQKIEVTDAPSVQACQNDSPRGTETNDVKKLKSQILCRNHEIKKLESEKHTLYTELQRKDLMLSNYLSKIKELEKESKIPKDRKKNVTVTSPQDETLPGTDEDKVFKACIAELKDCLREKEVQLAEKLKQNECLQSELRFFKNQAAQKEKIEENRPVCQCTSGVKADSDTERQSFKSVAFNDLECTQRTDYTMDTAVDSEMAKLGHSARAEEERCIRVLKEELDELLKYQHCHHESIEDQKRMLATQHARLKELTHKMLSDLSKSRNKLFYLRTHLLALSDTSDSLELSPKQEDSGYISPEDMATECHLIDTLRYRINNIKTENDCLKEQVRKLNNEVMSKTSSSTCRCKGYENSDKILQEVASALSNICGKKVPYEVSGRALTCESEVHPICQAMINLEAELNEKNQSICRMEERLSVKECEIKKLQEQLFALEEDCHSKNQQIVDLQIAVEFHVTSVERLQGANQHLEDQLAGFKRMIIQLQSRNATYFQELKEKDAKYKELSDQYQLLTQSLQSLRTNCACGALQIVYPVVAQAERLAYILSTEKTDEGYALQEYASLQQSQILVNEMDDQVRTMQRKIDLLEKTLEKREQDLQETNARMLQCAQQNGELTTELLIFQDQVFYLQAEDERLRGVVNRLNAEIAELRTNRRERESSLIAELNRLRQSMDQHVAALSKANDTINSLERQTQGYRRQGDVANKENAMLKAELYKARECAATQDGIEKSLRNQLMQTQSEMTFMKCDLERYTCLMQDIENLKKHCGRLKEANYDLVRKYNDLVEDYNNLEEEYRKLIDIKDQLFNEVENSRQWQKQQKEQDKIISSKFKKLEEHIDTLLDDRKKLIAKINDLHQDTILISGELEQFKDICTGSLRSES